MCHECRAGRYANFTGMSNCDSCPTGTKTAVVGTKLCDDCPQGKFQRATGQTICHVCHIGTYAEKRTGTACTDCAGGRAAGRGASACRVCPPGTYSAPRSPNCTKCDAGTASTAGSTICSNCPAGRYTAIKGSNNTDCYICPAGTFSIERSSGCTNCSKGQYSEAESGSCINCDAGKYQKKVGFRGDVNCTQCDFGRYSAIGAAVCVDCAKGTLSNNDNTDCTSCDAGRYASTAGWQYEYCFICPGGKYSGERSSVCSNCTGGTYSKKEAEECLNCPAGTHSGDISANCTDCPRGTYSGERAATVSGTLCTICTGGTYSGVAATECLICAAGRHSPDIAPNCSVCPTGTYSTARSATVAVTNCTVCFAGTYSSEGSTECTNCGTGERSFYESDGRLGGNCLICPGGKYSAVRSSKCSICEAGSASTNHSAFCYSCFPGKYSLVKAATCTNCSLGQYSAAGAGECIQCAEGYYADRTGTPECTACGLDERSSAGYEQLGSWNCTRCEPGRYSGGIASVCLRCTAGTFSPPWLDNGDCTDCPVGRFSGIEDGGKDGQTGRRHTGRGTENCTACKPGMIADREASSNCTRCKAGTFSNDALTECLDCFPGKYSLVKAHTCLNCSRGEYSAVGAGECSKCASGYAADREGMPECYQCQKGYRSSAPGAAWNCTQCPKGRYTANAGLNFCERCDSGKYMLPSRSGCEFCSILEAGLTSDAEASSCEYCASNYYRTVEDKNHSRYRKCLQLYDESLEDPRKDVFIDSDGTKSTYDGKLECRCVSCAYITDKFGTGTKAGVACRYADAANLYDKDGFFAYENALKGLSSFGLHQYRKPPQYPWINQTFLEDNFFQTIGPKIQDLILVGSTEESPGGYYRNSPYSGRVFKCANLSPAPCWASNYSYEAAPTRNKYVFDRGHCRPGFAGPLCSICELGYYEDTDTGFCYPCAEGQGNGEEFMSAGIFIFGFLVLALLGYATYRLYVLCTLFDFMRCKWKKVDDYESDEEEVFEEEEEWAQGHKYQWVEDLVNRCMERYLKVLLNTMQILAQVETLMSVSFPAPFNTAVKALESSSLSIASIIPMECIFKSADRQPTYYANFLQTAYMPIGASLLLVLDFLVERRGIVQATLKKVDGDKAKERIENRKRDEKIDQLSARNMGFFLVLTYLVLPGCAKMVISMLNCTPIGAVDAYYPVDNAGAVIPSDVTSMDKNGIGIVTFSEMPQQGPPYTENGEKQRQGGKGDSYEHYYLVADMSIDCNEFQYVHVYRPQVIAMLFVYILGIPMFYLTLVLSQWDKINPDVADVREAMAMREKDSSIQDTKFLWSDYKPKYCYFEIVETYRRILLTALLSLIPDAWWRRAMCIGMSLIFYMIYRDAQPFQWQDTNIISNVCQFQIILTYLACLMLALPYYTTSNEDNLYVQFPWDKEPMTFEMAGSAEQPLSWYVPGLIAVNMGCIMVTIVVQKSTFDQIKEQKRTAFLGAVKSHALEVDIGALKQDVDVLMRRLRPSVRLGEIELKGEQKQKSRGAPMFGTVEMEEEAEDPFIPPAVQRYAQLSKDKKFVTVLKFIKECEEGRPKDDRCLPCNDQRDDLNIVRFHEPRYPCYVIRLRDLIDYGETPVLIGHEQARAHDEQRNSFRVREYKCICEDIEAAQKAAFNEDMKAKRCPAFLHKLRPGGTQPSPLYTYFISHEWERFGGTWLPDDPKKSKYKWICNLKQHLGLVEHEDEIWIWWDYLSIPAQDPIKRELALFSLPAYIEMITNFLPLVRDAERHAALFPHERDAFRHRDNGTLNTYWGFAHARLEMMIALCPKKFDRRWRSGSLNMRFRFYEDPNDGGVGPLVSFKSLRRANPVDFESIFRCCMQATTIPGRNREPIIHEHVCDKPRFFHVVRRVALQYEEYVLSPSKAWDTTVVLTENVVTINATGEEEIHYDAIDHRPPWLQYAIHDEFIAEFATNDDADEGIEVVFDESVYADGKDGGDSFKEVKSPMLTRGEALACASEFGLTKIEALQLYNKLDAADVEGDYAGVESKAFKRRASRYSSVGGLDLLIGEQRSRAEEEIGDIQWQDNPLTADIEESAAVKELRRRADWVEEYPSIARPKLRAAMDRSDLLQGPQVEESIDNRNENSERAKQYVRQVSQKLSLARKRTSIEDSFLAHKVRFDHRRGLEAADGTDDDFALSNLGIATAGAHGVFMEKTDAGDSEDQWVDAEDVTESQKVHNFQQRLRTARKPVKVDVVDMEVVDADVANGNDCRFDEDDATSESRIVRAHDERQEQLRSKLRRAKLSHRRNPFPHIDDLEYDDDASEVLDGKAPRGVEQLFFGEAVRGLNMAIQGSEHGLNQLVDGLLHDASDAHEITSDINDIKSTHDQLHQLVEGPFYFAHEVQERANLRIAQTLGMKISSNPSGGRGGSEDVHSSLPGSPSVNDRLHRGLDIQKFKSRQGGGRGGGQASRRGRHPRVKSSPCQTAADDGDEGDSGGSTSGSGSSRTHSSTSDGSLNGQDYDQEGEAYVAFADASEELPVVFSAQNPLRRESDGALKVRREHLHRNDAADGGAETEPTD
jgi:hypothetical protein